LPYVVRAVHPLQQQSGMVLRRRREAAGLSQEALAAQANLHRNYVGLLERGQRMPSILVVQQLAAALDTTMSELLAEVEQEQN
jgi:transcriptional regulator with XRE-family HTH domain